MRAEDLESIKIKLASPENILSWSKGEVTKPETINYRTQRSEKDGLFCEKIFGPEKDFECYCGKYKRIRYKGVICDRCGVEVTKSQVRRERMGHIKLASPCSHIWFLRGVPSRMGMVLDIPMQQLERVIYFAAYIITKTSEEEKKKVLEDIENEYKAKTRSLKSETAKKTKSSKPQTLALKLQELRAAKDRAAQEVGELKPLRILSEVEYHELSLKYGEAFEAGTGAETLRKIFEKIDLKKEITNLKKELESKKLTQKIAENSREPGKIESPLMTRKKILRRLNLFQNILEAGIRPEWMFPTVLPVLPPDLRPMVQLDGGRYASSDLNDLYRRVINRNNRLKYLSEINAPEVIVRNEKRMLQEAIDALIDNTMRKGTTTQATTGGQRLLKSLADILKGKQGRFRQNLLGKRVDYSGRSVIVVGPGLKLNQCGLPKTMALELFKPFVIRKILERELVYNVRGASRLIEEGADEVWAILEEIVRDKLVLMNRAPTLHRLGIQAFQPILIEEESIRVHPLVCKAFNADFDGDQMAVHVPLSQEAQKEAKEIMLSTLNLLKPATGSPVVTPGQDIILGCYWLTKIKEDRKGEGKVFGGVAEAILAYEFGELDLRAKIKVRTMNYEERKGVKKSSKLQTSGFGFLETTLGRLIFNETLPQGYPFQNDLINFKKLDKIISEIIEKYGSETVQITLDKIKNLGFEQATLSGTSFGMDDLIVPPEKEKIIETAEKETETINKHFKQGLLSREEKTYKIIEVWQQTKSEIEKLVPKTLPEDGPVSLIVESGARGSWTQPVQMTGMKGLVINPAGQIIELPVKSSFKEGFDVLEYFISTHGARKGTADTALRTSTAGYLTRRLIDVAHEVVVTEEDCETQEGITIYERDAEELGQNLLHKIIGRTTLENIKSGNKIIVKKGEIIDWKSGQEIIDAKVEGIPIRSPMTCKTLRGICQKCYGWDLGHNKPIKLGEAVGIVAAQAIGEPGTQLTMRTFHTGGVVGGGDITFGLPRVQEIFEARIPGGKAEISFFEGKVLEIKKGETSGSGSGVLRPAGFSIVKIKIHNLKAKKSQILEYKIPANMALLVGPGQEIKKGQQLCEGSVDLKELFKVVGTQETQRHIIKEIQRIYISQGAAIHDKHIEVIIRQMFSRVRIKNPGASFFAVDEIVERAKFLEENKNLKKAGKEPAVANQILLGISRVALTTDSFLSSASFQETSRVLIKASLEGKEDKLRALKENVIIGKLIPAGTGFRK